MCHEKLNLLSSVNVLSVNHIANRILGNKSLIYDILNIYIRRGAIAIVLVSAERLTVATSHPHTYDFDKG